MRVLAAIGLSIAMVVGVALGAVLAVPIFVVSLVRRARAVHAEGVVCRAELIARDPVLGARLAGPAVVRMSGAFEPDDPRGTDVLGIEIRMQRTANDDPRVGDQDLLLASFESFLTAKRDRAATHAGDFLANRYSTVTPWWVPGRGPKILRLEPPPPASPVRAADRRGRLASDLAADRARFALTIDGTTVAELHLREQLAADAPRIRTSMWRAGRGLRPLGLRNGIRVAVYPASQLARRLRGG